MPEGQGDTRDYQGRKRAEASSFLVRPVIHPRLFALPPRPGPLLAPAAAKLLIIEFDVGMWRPTVPSNGHLAAVARITRNAAPNAMDDSRVGAAGIQRRGDFRGIVSAQ